MVSGDRGTLARGAMPTAQELARGAMPTGQETDRRPRPPSPASRRAPRAARERKPALAALALLLIVGGALGTAYLVIRNQQRVAAIEVTQPLGAGQQIPLSALHEVQIATGTGLSYVPWSEASQVTQFYAASAIPPGTLLSSAMVARSNYLAAGKAVVGLALKDGQLPAGLQAGDRLDIYKVSDAAQACPGTPGSMLASDAVVLGISVPAAASGRSAIDVRVALAPASAGAVACNAANGSVGVAMLPQPASGAG
jgi:hypothetical protein